MPIGYSVHIKPRATVDDLASLGPGGFRIAISGAPGDWWRHTHHKDLVMPAVRTLRLDEAAIDEMIVEGERLAFDEGWHPPLASIDFPS
jgi:hypothetical protein